MESDWCKVPVWHEGRFARIIRRVRLAQAAPESHATVMGFKHRPSYLGELAAQLAFELRLSQAKRPNRDLPATAIPGPLPIQACSVVPQENPATRDRIVALLLSHEAAVRYLEHPPTKTSAESARVRGVAMASGAKAMLVRMPPQSSVAANVLQPNAPSHYDWALCVLSATKKLDWKKLRKILGTSKAKMAPVDVVQAVTGCLPGAVPPLASAFPMAGAMATRTLFDASLLSQGSDVNFNCGLRTESVLGLSVRDLLLIACREGAVLSAMQHIGGGTSAERPASTVLTRMLAAAAAAAAPRSDSAKAAPACSVGIGSASDAGVCSKGSKSSARATGASSAAAGGTHGGDLPSAIVARPTTETEISAGMQCASDTPLITEDGRVCVTCFSV